MFRFRRCPHQSAAVVVALHGLVVVMVAEDHPCDPATSTCPRAEVSDVSDGAEDKEVVAMNSSLLQRHHGFKSERFASEYATETPAQSVEELQTKRVQLLNKLVGIEEELGSGFPSIDSITKAASAAFDLLVARGIGSTSTLTSAEVNRYKQRFMERFSGIMPLSRRDFDEMVRRFFYEEEPVITQALVDSINVAKLGWTSSLEDWALNLSMEDARILMGYVDGNETWNEMDGLNMSLAQLMSASGGESKTRLPTSFDSRQKWPKCAREIDHIRDQGKCGSCWAQAAANVMDARLCISSNGKFTGKIAWTSAAHITSCHSGHADGCQGGNPLTAFQGMAARGSPTASCVPYFGTGDSLQHFSGSNQASPACPKACTNKHGYSRSLPQDLFYASAASRTTSLETALTSIYGGGSIVGGFYVYQDFMSYKRGYYTPHSRTKVGGHAITFIGWAKDWGKIYLILVNSWGTRWGEHGLGKIDATCCQIRYYFPGAFKHWQPYPLPSGKPSGNCATYGCVGFTPNHGCQCNAGCMKYHNCCDDYAEKCHVAPEPSPEATPADSPAPAGSCAKYGCVGFTWSHSCQCNALCEKFGSCCNDYSEKCPPSCSTYGCVGFTPHNKCQCNAGCAKYHNCCKDYQQTCR